MKKILLLIFGFIFIYGNAFADKPLDPRLIKTADLKNITYSFDVKKYDRVQKKTTYLSMASVSYKLIDPDGNVINDGTNRNYIISKTDAPLSIDEKFGLLTKEDLHKKAEQDIKAWSGNDVVITPTAVADNAAEPTKP